MAREIKSIALREGLEEPSGGGLSLAARDDEICWTRDVNDRLVGSIELEEGEEEEAAEVMRFQVLGTAS